MKLKLIFLSMFLAIAAGSVTPSDSLIFEIYDLIGKLFLNALTLVVLPLVVSSIITGAMKLGQEQSVGKIALVTFRSFYLTSFFSVIFALLVVMLFSLNVVPLAASYSESIQEISLSARFYEILLSLIPSNLFAAASQGKLLGLIGFSFLFGICINKLKSGVKEVVSQFWQGSFQIMMEMTMIIMKFLPIGVFGLIAKAVSETGASMIGPVLYFFTQALLAQLLVLLVIIPSLLLMHKVSPFRFYQSILKPLITAFTTSSTAATLPVTLQSLEEAGLPARICSFVLPLGTSMNLAGTAAYCATAVPFLAGTMGVELTFSTYLTIGIMCFFTSWGMVTGIPSASLVIIIMILQSIGVTGAESAIALLLPVERLLDMIRTMTNVASNAACCQMVAVVEKKSVIA
ncbi:MAG: dicarboxylate/amino acid:cation symporter [Waddliaceae bacterium]